MVENGKGTVCVFCVWQLWSVEQTLKISISLKSIFIIFVLSYTLFVHLHTHCLCIYIHIVCASTNHTFNWSRSLIGWLWIFKKKKIVRQNRTHIFFLPHFSPRLYKNRHEIRFLNAYHTFQFSIYFIFATWCPRPFIFLKLNILTV